MNPLEKPPTAARSLALVLALATLILTGCSAIELHQQMASATADAEGASTAAGDATLAALHAAQANIAATVQVLAAQATEAAATLSALESTRTVQPATPTQATFAASSAETSLYGTVPIDSDRLNSIAALAFDSCRSSVWSATRAGEIYRLARHRTKTGALADSEPDLRGRRGNDSARSPACSARGDYSAS